MTEPAHPAPPTPPTPGPEGGAADRDGPQRWLIGPEGAPVVVENAEAVLAHLPYFLAGWPTRWAGPADGAQPADIRIEVAAEDAWRVVGNGPGAADFSFDNPYDAANGLAGALIGVLVARRADMVCLHAGAVQIGDGLVVVVGDSFAGKSSVALHLAVLGHRFYGDDRIAVTLSGRPQGLCLGLMPKVRLPLPADCGDVFREFVAGYTAMEGDGMAFLKLWDGEAASFGDTAPVRALVFLERRETPDAPKEDEPGLEPASRADLVRRIVPTAFAPHIDSHALVDGLDRLAGGAGAWRLAFASSRAAAGVLSRHFATGRMT